MTVSDERTRHALGWALVIAALFVAGCGNRPETAHGPPYTISGTIAGMMGSGLVLQESGGSTLPVSGAAFTFASAVEKGAPYMVTVLTQPSNPAQVCTISNGSGTAMRDVTNVAIACATTSFTISGTVTGLSGVGVVLQNNGGENLALSAEGAFTFATPVASGSSYAVTVLAQQAAQPPQVCTVANGSGIVGAAPITNVAVRCRRR